MRTDRPAIRPWQHCLATNRLPVVCQRNLFTEDRRVRHDLILPTVMNRELTVDVFEDCRITRGIRNRKVGPSRFRRWEPESSPFEIFPAQSFHASAVVAYESRTY